MTDEFQKLQNRIKRAVGMYYCPYNDGVPATPVEHSMLKSGVALVNAVLDSISPDYRIVEFKEYVRLPFGIDSDDD